MKVLLINKSDSTGGAAIVTFRLMMALRTLGIDARMLVVEKLTDSPYVIQVDEEYRYKYSFLAERLQIFTHNGFDRKDLFKADTAAFGLPLYRHPLVKEADIICLNWINQGMLSLDGIKKISRMGKPIIWTMHDMWNLTGVCHHAGKCDRYLEECGACRILHSRGNNDLSRIVHRRKEALYKEASIHFVAVSSWLEGKCRVSSLMRDVSLRTIPNAFPMPPEACYKDSYEGKISILFGAARLDDPIKGFPYLISMTEWLAGNEPELSSRIELVTFGDIRDSSILDRIAVPHRHLGRISGADRIRRIYSNAHIVVSSSLFETLPGTLVEGQAYGCIPVAFNRGGQPDIVDHLYSGFLARFSDDIAQGGAALGRGIVWAAENIGDEMVDRMYRNVLKCFSDVSVARRYIELFDSVTAESSESVIHGFS